MTGMILVGGPLQHIWTQRDLLRWLTVTSTALLTATALYWIGADSTAAGMVFLVLVVWSATQAGIALALFIAILCALCFDYFFLPPLHTFRLAGAEQWVEIASFLASCLVVGRVAELARRQTLQAEQRREDVERLLALSQEMMLHEDAAGLIRDLPRLIHRIFNLDAVVLYVGDRDQFFASTSDIPAGVKAGLRSMAADHILALALPTGFNATALMLGMRPVGALAWRSSESSREVFTAVTAQVAIALTRATALEANAGMEAARVGERLRTALIDSLTHELRTPLTSIRAAATTLLQGTGLDDASRFDLASIVDEEASRLDALIGEAVEMAEIDANVVQVHYVRQHPRALFDQALEESRSALAAHRVVVASNEPDQPAWFDPHLLCRVLRHLLENAARYTPAGGQITLNSWRTDERLEFSVADTGPGIEAADLPLIFEKFYRGGRGKKSGKGTGMGLAISRAILAAHGGNIEAANLPGQGACFHFWVPLIEKEPTRH